MLALRIAQMLHADDAIRGALSGRIFPKEPHHKSVMDQAYYPEAFDAGLILPTALVRDGGAFGSGPKGAKGGQAIVDVLLWDAEGRATIDAVLPMIRRVLENQRADTSAQFVYRLDFAGQSQAIRDNELDAEHAWSRWQSAYVVK